ncbi:MAG: glycosyltransferase family 39 protein, partial [Myxococcota bacterium]|nr:glycosyltransferase family 39 protein [Myxococcota bacterium]
VGWDQPISIYPQGQHVLTAALSPLLSSEPYDAWFQANAIFGTLTIPAAFLLGASLLERRRYGLVAASLLAFWPQHIRLSASESTQVGFVLWATLALTLAVLAARSGRFRTWAGAVFTAGAALTMRPEAPVFVSALVVICLAHGPEIRRRLLKPGHLLVLGIAAWLVVPWTLNIAMDESAAAFSPDSSRGEAIGLHSLWMMVQVLLLPSADNAFFDPITAPVWLYPLSVWGFIAGIRSGPRGATAGLLVGFLAYVLLYSGMEVAVSVWGMGRYHLSALPFVIGGCVVGVGDLWTRLPVLQRHVKQMVPATLGMAMVGCALWWPAVMAVPMDWQQELHWLIDLGRDDETRLRGDGRLVVPDNRRRFRDLSPRAPILALSAGRHLEAEAFTVAQALDGFLLGPDEPPTFYVEGLYCHLALGPGEKLNPQCQAMRDSFVLDPVATHTLSGEAFLTAYADIRSEGSVDVTLYRVLERRLTVEQTADLLPEPWPPGRSPPNGFDVMGSPTDDSMASSTR